MIHICEYLSRSIKTAQKTKKETVAKYMGLLCTLKDENQKYELKWSIVDRAPDFNPITKKCTYRTNRFKRKSQVRAR